MSQNKCKSSGANLVLGQSFSRRRKEFLSANRKSRGFHFIHSPTFPKRFWIVPLWIGTSILGIHIPEVIGGRTCFALEGTLRKGTSWGWPENARIVDRLGQYLDLQSNRAGTDSIRPQLLELQSVRGIGLLEGVFKIVSQCDPSVAALQDRLAGEVSSATVPDIESALSSVLANGALPEWFKSDVQLVVSRAYVQNALYDEALVKLQSISIESVSDPATYLFHLAICQHHLLRRDECLDSLSRLLERETELPTRYAITARLMESDIKPLKEDSLDEISRLMNDVERRLALGRTGKTVRDKQQAIIDKLEKKIDNMEQQLQQQQQQKQQQQQQKDKQNKGSQSNSPMEKSEIAEVKGAGEVDDKDIGNASGWGNLPPAQRQEALQNMTKDLPSHYREVIEAYFKRLSTTPNK